MAKAGKKKKILARTPKQVQVKKRSKLKLVYVPIQELSNWKGNPRINDGAAEKLAKLFAEHGFINPIIATPDKVIRAGHTRLKAAKRTDLKELPVLFVPFDSELEAQMYSLADNRAGEWSDWDYSMLVDLFGEMRSISPSRLQDLSGFKKQEIDWQGPEEVDPDSIENYKEGSETFVFKVENVIPKDKRKVLVRLEGALDGTGYTVEVY